MREILFRGQSIDDSEWFEGNLQKTYYCNEFTNFKMEEEYRITEYNYNPDSMSGFEEIVIPDTVGQYTGLTDKNGTKIFEGDIVKYETSTAHFHNAEVVYDMGSFALKFSEKFAKYPQHRILRCKLYCEVVGNIYDNPELIESEVK